MHAKEFRERYTFDACIRKVQYLEGLKKDPADCRGIENSWERCEARSGV